MYVGTVTISVMGGAMAFEKARQLIELAAMIQGRRSGVTLADVMSRFGGHKRTAQRMLGVLEEVFDGVSSELDAEGRKRWYLHSQKLRDFLSISAEDMTALDTAIMIMRDSPEAERLTALSDTIRVLVPKERAFRIEPDHEVLLEAMGVLARPGPRPIVGDDVSSAITRCLKAGTELLVDYEGGSKSGRRRLGPLGVLIGNRRYLVAIDLAKKEGKPQSFRMDLMQNAVASDELFARPSGFDLREFSSRSFGAYESEAEYGQVILRFSKKAAPRAQTYEFHPSQERKVLRGGKLEVRFRAGGHLEMAWHLYMWGNDVEVIEPAQLKAMVHEFRRSDFKSLP